MHERIQFIDHQGKKILLVDLSNCSADEVEEIVRRVPDYTTVQPLGSVLVLTDFNGASFDRDAILAVKETAVFDKPFVKKSALIGTEDLPASFYDAKKLLPAGSADFQNSRGSSGLAGVRFGGRLSRLRDGSGTLGEGEASTAEQRKAASTKRRESKGGQVSCPPKVASSGPMWPCWLG
jgi:hypothetical protein